jgi:CheY-like chemotaxis protein
MEEGNPLRRPLILVVDDNEDTRLVAYRAIEGLGYGVVLASDGVEAFGLARRFHPDLILTDQVMPRMGGKELCRLIKTDPDLSSTRVILMTGLYKRDTQRIDILRDSGADDYLLKPIGFDKLEGVLAGWFPTARPGS